LKSGGDPAAFALLPHRTPCPVPSTWPGRFMTGTCRGASRCFAGGWSRIWGRWAPGSSSRCCAFWSARRWPSSPARWRSPLRSGHELGRHRPDRSSPQGAPRLAVLPRRASAPAPVLDRPSRRRAWPRCESASRGLVPGASPCARPGWRREHGLRTHVVAEHVVPTRGSSGLRSWNRPALDVLSWLQTGAPCRKQCRDRTQHPVGR